MNHLDLRLFSAHWTDFLVSRVSSVSSSESAKWYSGVGLTSFLASGESGLYISAPASPSAILILSRVAGPTSGSSSRFGFGVFLCLSSNYYSGVRSAAGIFGGPNDPWIGSDLY